MASAIAVGISRRASARYDRAFYSGMAIAMAVTAFVGFGPTYYWKVFSAAPTTTVRAAGIKVPPLAIFGLSVGFILVAVAYDAVSRRRVHPVYVWGGGLFILSVPLRLAFSRTEVWKSIVMTLVGLVSW